MKYRLMTENDLEYVVEKNNEYYNNVEGCCWTYEKAYKRIYQVLTMKFPEVNCGIASMCFVLKKQQKYSIIFLFLTWLKHL